MNSIARAFFTSDVRFQNNQWLFGGISLRGNIEQAVGQAYQLVIEGVVGNGFQGDISIDDIALSPGTCPATSNYLFSFFRIYLLPFFLAYCDFESSDLCGYVNDPANTIDWGRYQAGVDPSSPSIDVSYGSSHGHFMFLKANATSGMMNSRLITPSYPDTSGSCIRWYMLLANNAILRVRTQAFGTLNPTVLYNIHVVIK